MISSILPSSTNEAPLLALSLLRLLSQNRIAEFHILLETLSREITASKDVSWVMGVSSSLMVLGRHTLMFAFFVAREISDGGILFQSLATLLFDGHAAPSRVCFLRRHPCRYREE